MWISVVVYFISEDISRIYFPISNLISQDGAAGATVSLSHIKDNIVLLQHNIA